MRCTIGGPTRIFSASREEHLSKGPTFCLTGFSYLRPISHHVRLRSLSERKKSALGQKAEREAAAEGAREGGKRSCYGHFSEGPHNGFLLSSLLLSPTPPLTLPTLPGSEDEREDAGASSPHSSARWRREGTQREGSKGGLERTMT